MDNQSLRQDFKNMFLYGTPNVFVWIALHGSIFFLSGSFLEYIPNRNDIRQFKLHKIIIGQTMHSSIYHLYDNFKLFTQNCYRTIDYLNKNKISCLYSFWFIYGSINIFGLLLSESFLYRIYKKFLLFYFKNDIKMIQNINENYDKISYSKNKMEMGSVGASCCIAGLETFNALSSIELCIKGLWILLFKDFDDDGLIDITDQIMSKYDIIEYDLDDNDDPTPSGDTKGGVGDNNDEDQVGLINKQEKYQIIRLCYDVGYLLYFLYYDNFAIKELWRHWRFGLQQRGAHNLLVLQSGLYRSGMTGHTGGAIAGVAVYIIFKMFCCGYRYIMKGRKDDDDNDE